VYHFNVVEELFNATDDVVVGKHIQVIGANDDSRLDMHQMYYLEGIRKSPIYPTYETSLKMDDFEKATTLIIFIKSYGSRYIFSCENSYEKLDNLPKIKRIIKFHTD
jgi:hypothetical protein